MKKAAPDATLWTAPRWRASDLGAPLPPSPHANSVCLPTWQDVCDYEEKKPRVLDRLQAGYPRFVIPPRVAQFLESHTAVKWVSHPSLPSHKDYDRAKKYLPKGAGAILGFGIVGGADAGKSFINNLKLLSLSLIHI